MKNIWAGITSALDTVEEKMSEHEDIAIETIQNETNRQKDWRKKNKASVSCGNILRGLMKFQEIWRNKDQMF